MRRVLFTLSPLEEVLRVAGIVLRERIDNGARPNLVKRVVTLRTAEEPGHTSQRPVAAVSKSTVHGVDLTFFEKLQMLLDNVHVSTFLHTRQSQWVARAQ